jgi:hypothetical protein
MGNLPLLLLGAGAVYFITKKPAKVSIASTKEPVIIKPGQSGSNLMGFKIAACNLTIYNKQKALDYAFKLGADATKPDYNGGNNWDISSLKEKLISDCIETEEDAKILMDTKEKALFVFDLMKYLYSGISSKSISFDQFGLDNMQKFKDTVNKIFGYDVSDFKIEIIKK